jgi:hypothetical protein
MNQTQVTVRAPKHSLARSYLRLASNIASGALGIGISILFGFSPLPRSFPLIVFTRTYPQVALVIGTLLAMLTLIALLATDWAPWTHRFRTQFGALTASFGISTLLSAVGSALLGILLGLGSLPSNLPLLQLLRTHPPLGIGLIGALLLLIILAPVFAFDGGSPEPGNGSQNKLGNPLLLSIITSAGSSMLFVSLLAVVLLRPTWCPTSICLAAVIVHPRLASYDANLEIFPVAVESATFAVPGYPNQYSLPQKNLPRQIVATRIDIPAPPVRIVVGVHNLLRSAHGDILIEQVSLLVDDVGDVPNPLDVWTPGAGFDYTTDPMTAVYRGEQAGAKIEAFSTLRPPALVHLDPGESDQIDVQLVGQDVAQITFRVVVAYHVTTQPTIRTLTLAQQYTVIFGTAANWHVYELQQGQLVPARLSQGDGL